MDFSQLEPSASDALMTWYKETKTADWASFADIKKTFNSTDAVGDGLFVFNIRGNHYRLIARMLFNVKTVFIKFIGTHKAYDQVNLKDL